MSSYIAYGNNQFRLWLSAHLFGFGFSLRCERDYSRLVILGIHYPRGGFALRLWGDRNLHRFFLRFKWPRV